MVVVVVAPNDGLCVTEILHTHFFGDIGKGSIPVVAKKLAGCLQRPGGFVPDIQVEVTVVVVIAPGGCLGGVMHVAQPCVKGDIRERAIAVVTQQGIRMSPALCEPCTA